MTKRHKWGAGGWFLGSWLIVCSFIVVPQSEARELVEVLGAGVSGGAFGVSGAGGSSVSQALAGAFAGGVQEATQRFPLASVSPAFTYRFDPTLNIFKPTSSVVGPLFSERSLTLGRGQLNFSMGYTYIDFDELNGTGINRLVNPVPIVNLDGPFLDTGIPGPNGQPLLFSPVSLVNNVIRMDLQAHVVTPTLRYGLTDNWDIGISIPILHTSLKVRTEARTIVSTSINPVDNTFGGAVLGQDANGNPDPTIASAFVDAVGRPAASPETLSLAQSQNPPILLSRASGSKTGIGDITLRSKYHFWERETGGAALGLNLQLPSGNEDNFHGTGDTHLQTFLYLSEIFWNRFEPHLNVGIDFNTVDVDRSSFLYAVGTTLQIGPLGFIVDFIGRSEFEGFKVATPQDAVIRNFPLDGDPNTCTDATPCSLDLTQPQVSSFIFPEQIKRNDTIDFSFGLRYALGQSGSAFFGAVIPLNNDGFRSDFVPAGGIEYTF